MDIGLMKKRGSMKKLGRIKIKNAGFNPAFFYHFYSEANRIIIIEITNKKIVWQIFLTVL